MNRDAVERDAGSSTIVDLTDAEVRGVSPQPLRLRGLPPALRVPAVMALSVVAAWSGLLLLTALGYGVDFDPSNDVFGLMNDGSLGAALVRVGTATGFGVAAVAATASATHSGWGKGRGSRIGRRCVLLVVATVGLVLLSDVLSLSNIFLAGDPGTAARGRLIWCRGLGWSGVAAMAALPFLAHPSAFARKLSLGFAAFPFVGWVVASFAMGRLTAPWEANVDWRGDVLRQSSVNLELVLVLFLAWEIVAWTELVAGGAAWLSARGPLAARRTVVALIAVKLVWLGAGHAGVLPAVLGGNAAVWRASAGDGAGSWITAGVVCAALISALATRRALLTRLPALPWRPVIVLLAVLCLPGIVAGVLEALILPLFRMVPAGPLQFGVLAVALFGAAIAWLTTQLAGMVEAPSQRTLALAAVNACLVAGYAAAGLDLYGDLRVLSSPSGGLAAAWVPPMLLPGALAAHYFLAPGAAFVIALMLAVRARRAMRDGLREHDPRWLAPGAFALALAAIALLYVLPRLPQLPLRLDQEAVGATGDMLAPQFSYSVYPVAAPGWERWWGGPAGTFELVTLDALLTCGVGLLVWRWWAGRERDWRVLSFVVVGSTVLAHSSTLAPGGWLGNRWYYLAFTVPIAWQFLYRAREFNGLARARPHLALLNLAVVVLLLTLLGYRLLIGDLNPSLEFEDLVLGYSRGFTVDLILLPLGIIALARRLRGRVA